MKMKNFLKCCEDLVIQESGASAFELEKLKARQFPQAHLDLLSITNGLEFYGGYYRLFGTDSTQAITLDSWNSDELWKDVWRDYVSDYYFFGMSAIGDQFAYRLKDGNIQSHQVYYLDGITMDVIEIYDSFEAFFEREFVLKAQGGMESIFVSARERFGNLDLSRSCIYSPSLMIVNDPSVENLMLLPTKDVMTINGDLFVQLSDSEESITKLEQYLDASGRARVKVIFDRD